MFVCCLLGQDSLEKEILNLNENIPGKIKVNKKRKKFQKIPWFPSSSNGLKVCWSMSIVVFLMVMLIDGTTTTLFVCNSECDMLSSTPKPLSVSQIHTIHTWVMHSWLLTASLPQLKRSLPPLCWKSMVIPLVPKFSGSPLNSWQINIMKAK